MNGTYQPPSSAATDVIANASTNANGKGKGRDANPSGADTTSSNTLNHSHPPPTSHTHTHPHPKSNNNHQANSMGPLVEPHQELNDFLETFWGRWMDGVENDSPDFKTYPLPLARIKKVMKSDEDVKVGSPDFGFTLFGSLLACLFACLEVRESLVGRSKAFWLICSKKHRQGGCSMRHVSS